ncbi:hypothetical protein PI125_g8507 [Phytophthora idaei]|nr:hypothetical protein PI125_g8507 [Phytophthora idaei]KAG3157382.1 hypothetical protein PI126_g8346 [Phytophthora idaei]
MMTFIKDETLAMWMTLFAPVYLWWNQWNLSHPSKLVTYNDAQIARDPFFFEISEIIPTETPPNHDKRLSP